MQLEQSELQRVQGRIMGVSLLNSISDTRAKGCTDLQSPGDAWMAGNVSDAVFLSLIRSTLNVRC